MSSIVVVHCGTCGTFLGNLPKPQVEKILRCEHCRGLTRLYFDPASGEMRTAVFERGYTPHVVHK